MRIPPLTDLSPILWEGPLAPPPGMKGPPDGDAPIASIGTPSLWADGQLLGEGWRRPLGGGRYHLARLFFTLRPTGRAVVTQADFCLTLQSPGALVYDAYPLRETVEQDRDVTLSLSPKLKLGAVEAELGAAETTIDMGRVIPVVEGYGLGEPQFCWRHTAHRRYPLAGSRVMVAVVHLPDGLPWAAATLELSATVETRFGPVRVGMPDTAQRHAAITLG